MHNKRDITACPVDCVFERSIHQLMTAGRGYKEKDRESLQSHRCRGTLYHYSTVLALPFSKSTNFSTRDGKKGFVQPHMARIELSCAQVRQIRNLRVCVCVC